ncbi:hypothetical protein BHM03_00025358 [Ensete ventricosum]|nr:hypothetical protein BHM03_00025358 [Ensete ventricosum]
MGVLKPIKPLNSISLEVDGSNLYPCGVGGSVEPKIVLRAGDPPDRVSFFPFREVNLHAWIIEIRGDVAMFLRIVSPILRKLGSGDLSMRQEDVAAGMIRAAGELDYFSAHIHLREPDKSEDKVESATMPQKQIYRSRRKGCRCKATDSRAMGLAAPWYCRGGTSMESLIPCTHGGRALVVKGAEEVENAEANSKYQDRVIGQRPRNFIRPVSMDFSSR